MMKPQFPRIIYPYMSIKIEAGSNIFYSENRVICVLVKISVVNVLCCSLSTEDFQGGLYDNSFTCCSRCIVYVDFHIIALNFQRSMTRKDDFVSKAWCFVTFACQRKQDRLKLSIIITSVGLHVYQLEYVVYFCHFPPFITSTYQKFKQITNIVWVDVCCYCNDEIIIIRNNFRSNFCKEAGKINKILFSKVTLIYQRVTFNYLSIHIITIFNFGYLFFLRERFCAIPGILLLY